VGDVPLSTNNKKSTYADYMLLEFQKTPYVWQMKDYSILGVDTATKNIIVDITYDTNSTLKTVQPDSTIIKGDKDYELKMKVRYDRWMEYLAAKYGSSDRYVVNQAEDLTALKAEFESVYGPVEEIIKSQRHLSLSQEISETRTQKTYTGMTDYELEQNGATMVVRHIFEPDYVLGIQQGYTLKHMYLTDYTLKNVDTEYPIYTGDNAGSVSDSVIELLRSYYQCKDEEDFAGLKKLTNNFQTIDRHFGDYFDITYRKHDSFTVAVHNVSNNWDANYESYAPHIECIVTVSDKYRAIGSNMTMPLYTEKYYYVIDLNLEDKRLEVSQEVLLSTKLEGEPSITGKDVEVTGFSSTVVLSSKDKADITQLMADFGVWQLNDCVDDETYKAENLIDLSLSSSEILKLQETAKSIGTDTQKKSVFLQAYIEGTTNYASIKVRELVQKESGGIRDYVITYNFINKGGKWYVYGINKNGNDVSYNGDLTTKGALCVVSVGKVEKVDVDTNSAGIDEENTAEVVKKVDVPELTPQPITTTTSVNTEQDNEVTTTSEEIENADVTE
jgi:hypothetical protein